MRNPPLRFTPKGFPLISENDAKYIYGVICSWFPDLDRRGLMACNIPVTRPCFMVSTGGVCYARQDASPLFSVYLHQKNIIFGKWIYTQR